MDASLTINFAAASGSFPFQPKSIPLFRDVRVILGSEILDTSAGEIRTAASENGWFAPRRPIRITGIGGGNAPSPVSPLPLSSCHAEIWWDGQRVYIRDLESPFGTYVNNAKITRSTTLKTDDIISLGSKIPRNDNTPSYITDEHLRPVIGKITLLGIST